MPRSSVKLLSDDLWPSLTRLAKRGRCHVAVAYVGLNAPQILPLRKGSILVCDFSQAAVERGLTHPEAIRTYLEAGVEVHSWANLHAKVYAFDDVAIVGSSNASAHSANVLTEAAIRITDPSGVQACCGFVQSLRGDRVLPSLVKLRAKQYRPAPTTTRNWDNTGQSPLWIAIYKRDATDAAYSQAEKGDGDASLLLSNPNDGALEWFEWSGKFPEQIRQHSGEIIVRDLDGCFLAPGRFLKLEPVSGGRSSIVWIERPATALPIVASKAKGMLGPDFGAMLDPIKSSRLIRDQEFAKRLRQLWLR